VINGCVEWLGLLAWTAPQPRLLGRGKILPKAQKAIIFGCPHFPFQDGAAIDWLLTRVAKEKPHHIAFIGDAIQMARRD
jgi:hypothetical protein